MTIFPVIGETCTCSNGLNSLTTYISETIVSSTHDVLVVELSWPTAVQVELDQLEGPIADQHGLPARVRGVEGHLNTKMEVHPYRREGQ